MSTPYDEVTAKLEWAEKNIPNLERIEAGINRDCAVSFYDDAQRNDRIYELTADIDISMDVSLIIGDIINNLRCSLDHLAHYLVTIEQHSPGPFRNVYFPIASSADKYETEKGGKIGRAGDVAIKIIDRIEPYRGGHGHDLWVLNKLNIADKHHLILAAGLSNPYHSMSRSKRNHMMKDFLGITESPLGDAELSVAFQTQPAFSHFPLKRGDILAVIPNDEVDEHMQFTFNIAFYKTEVLEREPVVAKLRILANSVRSVMRTFATEGFF